MSNRLYTGLFVSEGTSDLPLADIVETLFVDRGVPVRLSKPDFTLLRKVPKDVESRLRAGMELLGSPVDVIVVHRDADRDGYDARRAEVFGAMHAAGVQAHAVLVIPIRMTEAWLLLDEMAIRQVAGNPRGREGLGLPARGKVETCPDPKQVLLLSLLNATGATGRRRERVAKRFTEHRRQLLQRLDRHGPVSELSGWKKMAADLDVVAEKLKSSG
ncbi:hypothetical protein NE236_32390 [Actinoallomurus purpureus]|uniref:hypothetical protein n=1 Tax=Actinoallomurus purpureus TaxID=478114 RepID=UPI002092DABC|nr:hypothetical protein [Actinoallomurus purpureus]MCO6009681.1 hypothetical protein [Actinoallomurus purpureus]